MSSNFNIFNKIKDSLLNIDPVSFCEKYLTLDGKPFRLTGNGYKPFADIYRYIGVKALEPDAKPVVLVAGRQLGKSTMASALEMFFMGCGHFGNSDKPPIRVIHAFPTLDLAFAYSKTKLSTMISSSVVLNDNSKAKIKSKSYMQSLLDPTSPTNDSLQFKQFIGGNHIWIESTGIDGSRFRGKTVDVIFFDEVQMMPAAALANAAKVLTKAQYGKLGDGIQVYFGTPTQSGSEYWHMWNMSSQQYYYLGCEKCQKHFPLYTPNSNDWEKIWLYGYIVRCTHCGHEQDKRAAAERGKWVSVNNNTDAKLVGFHINQLYIPEFTREKIESEKPGNSPINTEKAFQNEVLGEFYKGEATIITQEELIEKCGDAERKFVSIISPEDESLVFLGIDIGAKSDLEQLVDSNKIRAKGQSYSTAVVVSVIGMDCLSIEFATKFKRNDLASKKELVDQVMRQYSANLAVCDLGYANDFNEIMQNQYGEKFIASQATGKVNEHIKYNSDIFPRVVLFERDFYIRELYEKMKKGNIRFPMGNYEQIFWLIQHCTSMEIKPSVSRSGDINPHYVKGSSPNDGFSALLNAYIAYKFYITNGFKIKNKFSTETNIDKRPPVIGGYISRRI